MDDATADVFDGEASTSPDDAEALQRLSEGLREAFSRVAQSSLSPEEKGRWQQRLIAVTNSAKRDTARSQASLDRFNDDWNREFPS